jgi:transcriptional regulator with XRE-family HTH domain
MAAAHVDPPAVARQRVRRALRKARDQTPMSQGDVARRLGWSLSKMQRIEGGDVGVSPTDLHALLDLYGVTDQDRIRRLTDDAHASRRQRYVTPPEHRENLTQGLMKLVQFEREASSIRTYQPLFYPGFMQTPAVAEAILESWKARLSSEARRVRYDVRMARRKQIVESTHGPETFVVLDESVLQRRVVSAKVTAEQLEDIAELSERPNLHIRIMPYLRGPYMPALGAFQLLLLGEDQHEGMLYQENYLRDELTHDAKEVEFFRDNFERLWEQSRNENASRLAIVAEAARLRASLDDDEPMV